MTTDLARFREEATNRILEVASIPELLLLEKEYFGRKSGSVTDLMKDLRVMSPQERKDAGRNINDLKEALEEAIASRKAALQHAELSALATADTLDFSIDLPPGERGHLHLLPEFVRQIEEVFGRMGFDVAYGPEVEEEKFNFDMLNIPPEHPARDMQDTFWVKGEGRKVLRTQTSPVQIRYMLDHKPPFRMICPGKTYRKDADATHSPMFQQFEGLMIGKDISLRHLKGVMIEAVKELVSPDITFRFRTGFFPFVEPGLEMDIQWRGGKETKEGRWLEVAGCGMVHPQVLRNVGIDPLEWQGFAFGFGVERLVMIKHQIPNIRLFYQGDMRFLRQW